MYTVSEKNLRCYSFVSSINSGWFFTIFSPLDSATNVHQTLATFSSEFMCVVILFSCIIVWMLFWLTVCMCKLLQTRTVRRCLCPKSQSSLACGRYSRLFMSSSDITLPQQPTSTTSLDRPLTYDTTTTNCGFNDHKLSYFSFDTLPYDRGKGDTELCTGVVQARAPKW